MLSGDFGQLLFIKNLRTPAYTPGDGQTSWVYSTNPVLHLYIHKLLCNCQKTSAVVPLAVPPSTVVTPIRLYPLYCTLYLCTLTRLHLQALVALSFAFVSEIFHSNFTVYTSLATTLQAFLAPDFA